VRDAADKVIHTTNKVAGKADHKSGNPLLSPLWWPTEPVVASDFNELESGTRVHLQLEEDFRRK
jgi:hypothetical protein